MICLWKLFVFTQPTRYADLIGKAQERHANLEESIKKNAMLREAKEIESWMAECVSVINSLLKPVFICYFILKICLGLSK